MPLRRLMPVTVGILLACGGAETTTDATPTEPAPAPATISEIILSAPDSTLAVGEIVQLTVAIRMSDGTAPTNPRLTWRSLDEDVATVNSTGEVRAVSSGVARIRAYASSSRYAELSVTVLAPPPLVSHVIVTPQRISLRPGQSVQLSAKAFSPTGEELKIPIAWHASDASLLEVSTDGLVTALTESEYQLWVRATAEGAHGFSTIDVDLNGRYYLTEVDGQGPSEAVVGTGECPDGTSTNLYVGQAELYFDSDDYHLFRLKISRRCGDIVISSGYDVRFIVVGSGPSPTFYSLPNNHRGFSDVRVEMNTVSFAWTDDSGPTFKLLFKQP